MNFHVIANCYKTLLIIILKNSVVGFQPGLYMQSKVENQSYYMDNYKETIIWTIQSTKATL